jgi:hypothetical protein
LQIIITPDEIREKIPYNPLFRRKEKNAMKNSKNGNFPWPILTLSTIGLASAIAVTAHMAKKKKFGPLEKAADLIGRITQETKEKMDTIVQDVRSHLSSDEPEGQSGLSELTTEFKEKLDAMAESMKNKIRAIRGVNGATKTVEVNEPAKS